MEKVSLLVHPPMEVLYALYAVGTGKVFFEMLENLEVIPGEELKNSIKQLNDNISHFVKKELEYFYSPSGIGYIFYKTIVKNSKISDMNKLMERLLETDNMEFIFDLVESVCKNTISKMEGSEVKELQFDREKMLSLVVNEEFQDGERKQRVLEVLQNPDEIKERLALLLRQFYTKAFARIEEDVMELSRQALNNYAAMFNKDGSGFLKKYMNIQSRDYTGGIKIHVSFFKQIGWHNYSREDEDMNHWFVLGACSDLLLDDKISSERISGFFKVLSDKKRVEIVRLLSERPWYGQELAEKLEITPATVSYHMTFLSEEELISVVRLNNRFYYSLNHLRLKDMFQFAGDFLLHDEN